MKEFWNMVQMVFAAVGGWLGYFLGGNDGLLIALVLFVAVDYLTGVMCAVSDKTLSSNVGFRGHLQEGADLPLSGNRQYPGCPCHRHRVGAADGGDLFLYFQ